MLANSLGVVINAVGGHSGPALPMQINSMPLADFDSGSASCHARQQPGVVINAIGGHSGPPGAVL